MDAGLNSTALGCSTCPEFRLSRGGSVQLDQLINEETVRPMAPFASRQGQPFETVVGVGLDARRRTAVSLSSDGAPMVA